MRSGRFVVGFALLAGASATIFAQLPIPVQGQRGGAQGQQAPQGQRGQRGAQPATPASTPVVSPIAMMSQEITDQGPEHIKDLKDCECNVGECRTASRYPAFKGSLEVCLLYTSPSPRDS